MKSPTRSSPVISAGPCPAGPMKELRSERDDRELRRHDKIAVDLLAPRRNSPGRLFVIEDYPKDLMSFYGQGYSISRFLVEMGGRPASPVRAQRP